MPLTMIMPAALVKRSFCFSGDDMSNTQVAASLEPIFRSSVYNKSDYEMVRTRYRNGDSVFDISNDTGIHDSTIYKYCADLVKEQKRRSSGRPSKIDYNYVVIGLREGRTQAQIAISNGVSRQAVCLFIKRHKLRDE